VDVHIEAWADSDLDLLLQANTPAMTEHLGGPETEAKVLARHRRYLEVDGTGWMFRIAVDGAPAGSIGYWDRFWNGMQVFETGWAVLPAFQGKGIATLAARLVIDAARAHGRHRFLHAFPSIHHPASNGICRAAGFTLRGECAVEYPTGSLRRCNDWCLELPGPPTASGGVSELTTGRA